MAWFVGRRPIHPLASWQKTRDYRDNSSLKLGPFCAYLLSVSCWFWQRMCGMLVWSMAYHSCVLGTHQKSSTTCNCQGRVCRVWIFSRVLLHLHLARVWLGCYTGLYLCKIFLHDTFLRVSLHYCTPYMISTYQLVTYLHHLSLGTYISYILAWRDTGFNACWGPLRACYGEFEARGELWRSWLLWRALHFHALKKGLWNDLSFANVSFQEFASINNMFIHAAAEPFSHVSCDGGGASVGFRSNGELSRML